MKQPRFFYFYLTLAIIELVILIINLTTHQSRPWKLSAASEALLCVGFAFLAFKVYREKNDKDLM